MPLHHIFITIFVMALWGANFVAIKLGLSEMPPLLFSALRFTLTAIPVIFMLGSRDAPWKIIIAVGIVLGVFKFTFLFIGIDIGVPAGIASLVLQSQAFFTVIMAALILRESPAWNDWIGLLMAFAGIAVISSEASGINSLYGLALVVLAGLCWAVANLIMKRAGNVSMFRLIVYMSLIPPIPLFITSWNLEGRDRILDALSNISLTGLGALLYVVIAATLFGFAVWGFMLNRYAAAKVAPFSLLVPVFGLTFSWMVLAEKISQLEFVGAIMVVAGLICIYGRDLLNYTGQNGEHSTRQTSQ